MDQPAASTTTAQTKTPVVITENVSATKLLQMKECNVCIERLPTTTPPSAIAANSNLSYNMHTRPPKAEIPHRTSDRPCATVNYSKFMSGNEDDISPPHKKRTVDLKQMPSNSRIASQNYYTKPSTTPQPTRRNESSTITKPASSEETKVAIEALLSVGNDVIPENDITAENSALVPTGINVPDNPDTVYEGQNAVLNRPTPLHQLLHLYRSHNQTPQTMTQWQTKIRLIRQTAKQQAQIVHQLARRRKVL